MRTTAICPRKNQKTRSDRRVATPVRVNDWSLILFEPSLSRPHRDLRCGQRAFVGSVGGDGHLGAGFQPLRVGDNPFDYQRIRRHQHFNFAAFVFE